VEDWPTTFELATVLALVYFARQGIDVAVLEVGRGGQFDGVNAVPHNLALMTPISLDHTDVLGNTLVEIAREKAGVVPAGGIFVSGPQPAEASEVLKGFCRAREAAWWYAGEDTLAVRNFGQGGGLSCVGERVPYPVEPASVRLPLGGTFQQANLRLALAGVAALRSQGWDLPGPDVVEGLEGVRWPGRFEVVHRSPLALVDGAHNPESAGLLREALDARYPGRRVVWVVGFSSGKDIAGVLAALRGEGDRLVATRSHHPRAVAVDTVARAARQVGFGKVLRAADVRAAWDAAAGTMGSDGLVCFTGSLFVVAGARELFGLAEEAD